MSEEIDKAVALARNLERVSVTSDKKAEDIIDTLSVGVLALEQELAYRQQDAETLDADIAFVDRAVAARIQEMRRHTTMTGDPMADEHWKEMDGLTRAWDRIRHQLGRR